MKIKKWVPPNVLPNFGKEYDTTHQPWVQQFTEYTATVSNNLLSTMPLASMHVFVLVSNEELNNGNNDISFRKV